MDSSVKIQQNFKSPTNPDRWNKLCKQESNYLQTTFFNEVQKYFALEPYYIELTKGDQLLAGLKLYYWQTHKGGKLIEGLSKRLTQHGEWIIDNSLDEELKQTVKELFHKSVREFIDQSGIVSLNISAFYGETDKLLNFESLPMERDFLYNVGTTFIDKDDEALLKSFNRNTRRNINKANENGLVFRELKDDLTDFFKVMTVIFEEQQTGVHKPNFDYINHVYKNLAPTGNVDVFIAYHNDRPLATTFFIKYGQRAYSSFGGAVKNDVGAGHFAYFELMKRYRDEGIREFIFGQTSSAEHQSGSDKFDSGISGFKRGFDLHESPGYTKHFIFRSTKHKLWGLISKVYGKYKNT